MPSSCKTWLLAPKEDWICDRMVDEWYQGNPDISVRNVDDANVIWLLSDWCWQQVPRPTLYSKKVLVTVHHVVPEKFGPRERLEFEFRDRFITAYHVPNAYTESFVKTLTKKPIHVVPYWANQHIWRPTGTKEELRNKHELPLNGYLIGSFQRDTEGHDLISPKLEKGPDLLANALIEFLPQMPNLHVVLAGWRRQYLINRLEAANIPFTYFEKPELNVVNELYQTLDLYPVAARYEGGPQSFLECGLLRIPMVSRPVGMAGQVLPTTAINEEVTQCEPAIPNIEHLRLPKGFVAYRKLLESL